MARIMRQTTNEPGVEHYALFDTAIGALGLAWNARGVTRLQLPERDEAATERRVRARAARRATDIPPHIADVLVVIRRYAKGERTEFDFVAVDLPRADSFERAVYAAARAIRFGQTLTYGELAQRAAHPGEARAVGQALARNPVPVIIPCHRILAAGARLGGFSAPGGAFTKEKLLALEGVFVDGPRLPGL